MSTAPTVVGRYTCVRARMLAEARAAVFVFRGIFLIFAPITYRTALSKIY